MTVSVQRGCLFQCNKVICWAKSFLPHLREKLRHSLEEAISYLAHLQLESAAFLLQVLRDFRGWRFSLDDSRYLGSLLLLLQLCSKVTENPSGNMMDRFGIICEVRTVCREFYRLMLLQSVCTRGHILIQVGLGCTVIPLGSVQDTRHTGSCR